jgi:23S rRNA pseudouridine1911/1915/1917 synthase
VFYFSDVWNTDVTDKTDKNGFFNKAIIKNITKHIVPDSTEGSRLQAYAKEIFNTYIPSTQGIKKAIKRGQILVNDNPSNTGYRVCPGDEITLVRGDMNPPKQFELNLEVVFEDEDLAVIIKPAGIPTSGNQFKTIQNALLFNLKNSTASDALNWPQPLHRLDAPTSGLLLVAKTKSAQINLGKQFENKTIQKQYHAIVIGQPQASGEWTTPIGDKPAHTTFETLKTVPSLRNQRLSLVKLTPHTGRTHQLRIHLSQAGFPIMGDKIYGNPGEVFRGKGLFLAATDLAFQHPADDHQISLCIPVPHKFESLLSREQRRYKKWRES